MPVWTKEDTFKVLGLILFISAFVIVLQQLQSAEKRLKENQNKRKKKDDDEDDSDDDSDSGGEEENMVRYTGWISVQWADGEEDEDGNNSNDKALSRLMVVVVPNVFKPKSNGGKS